MASQRARTNGFRRTAQLVAAQVRRTAEGRGFAEAKLLTRWPEIAGAKIAAIARPADIRYGSRAFGATLTLLTHGAHGPVLEMQIPQLRRRINAVYGYNAIARIRIVQTAASGFGEDQAAFAPQRMARKPLQNQTLAVETPRIVTQVSDPALRAALAQLGRCIQRNDKKG